MNYFKAPPSRIPTSTSFQRFFVMICTISNTINPSDSFKFIDIVAESLAGFCIELIY